MALQQTWRINPDSFFDVASVMSGLATKSQSDLVATIANMALQSPESLTALGVDAFDHDEGEAWY